MKNKINKSIWQSKFYLSILSVNWIRKNNENEI